MDKPLAATFDGSGSPPPAQRVLVTGASGLIGSALVPALRARGHEVRTLSRRPRGPGAHHWDPERGEIDTAALEGIDAVVQLAGESIGARRWNAAWKARIRESRVAGTRFLGTRLARLAPRPALLLNASALGIYGDRGDEELTEGSAPGAGFLADVCRDWEGATAEAEAAGARVVLLRIGVVLSMAGGALPRMLPPFRLGLGGRLGSGRQYMSWISLDDLVAAAIWILERPSLRGAIHACAPAPVTNAEFTRALGRVLGRPASLAVPPFALRLLIGEFADAGLLSSQRAVPARLLASGFDFRHPDIDGALRHALGARIA
jgi:uncharacterized protein (TIGR01777 family)